MMTTSTWSSLDIKLATCQLLGMQKTPCLTADTVSCFLIGAGNNYPASSRQTLSARLAKSETVASCLTEVTNLMPLLVTTLILIFLPLPLGSYSSSTSISPARQVFIINLMKTLLWILTLLSAVSAENTIEYDMDASRRMRTYSLIAHCSEDQIVNWHCKLCSQTQQLQDVQYIENKATQVMVYAGYMKSIDKIVFIFRGTIDVTNWIQDFTFYQAPYGKCQHCKIHQGFYLSYLSVATSVKIAYKMLRDTYLGKEVVMTGASLGGALATVAAIELHTQQKPISELHTYGSPRVGNVELASHIKKNIPKSLRVVHNRDIVPHLPLIDQNYHHIPYEILFDEQMKNYKICNEEGEDESCSNSYYPNYSVEDHVTYWIKLNVPQICAQP